MSKYRPMIGPVTLEMVPIGNFTKIAAPLRDAWEITGPSAERNLATAPLWAVIAAAYLEGIQHATAALQEPSP